MSARNVVLAHDATGEMFRVTFQGAHYWTTDPLLAHHFDSFSEALTHKINNAIPHCHPTYIPNENSNTAQT